MACIILRVSWFALTNNSKGGSNTWHCDFCYTAIIYTHALMFILCVYFSVGLLNTIRFLLGFHIT